MKKTLLVLAIAAVAVALGLQLYLQHWLDRMVRTVVLPRAARELGVSVTAGATGFRLLGGHARMSDVRLGNPEGFSEPELARCGRVDVDLNVLSLLKRRATEVESVRIRDLAVTVVRNRAGEFNTDRVGEARKRSAAEDTGVSAAEAGLPREAPSALPLAAVQSSVRADAVSVEATLRYVDHQVAEPPFALDYRARLDLDGVSNAEGPAAEWAKVRLKGHLATNAAAVVSDLTGRLAPVVAGTPPSFDLAGTVTAIDPALFRAYTQKSGFESDPFAIDVNLVCRDGEFDASQSLLTLHLRNVTVSLGSGKGRGRKGGSVKVASLTVPVPIGGTVDAPRVQWDQAMAGAAAQALVGNLDGLLKSGGGGKGNDILGQLDKLFPPPKKK